MLFERFSVSIWFHLISFDFISFDFIWFHLTFHFISFDFIWFHLISFVISRTTFLVYILSPFLPTVHFDGGRCPVGFIRIEFYTPRDLYNVSILIRIISRTLGLSHHYWYILLIFNCVIIRRPFLPTVHIDGGGARLVLSGLNCHVREICIMLVFESV